MLDQPDVKIPIDEDVIKCQDCSRTLGAVVVTESNTERKAKGLKGQKTKFLIQNCPRCTGSSKESKIFSGSTSIYCPDDQYYLEPLDYEVIDDIIVSTMKVAKK